MACTALLLGTFMWAANVATAGTLDFMLDLNTPAADSDLGASAEISRSKFPAFCLGFYSRPLVQEQQASRMGVVLGRHALNVDARVSTYSAWNLQWGFDYPVYQVGGVCLFACAAAGLSFIFDNSGCNDLSCWGPDSVTLVTPSCKAAIAVSQSRAVLVEVKGWVLLNDAGATYPFSRGIVVSVGIELN
jgi:hypothetical protein